MSATEKVNILMVDDQPGKLITYEAILGDLGDNLISATSATEALEHLLKQEIAVILMDVSMPDLDGFELAAMIRQHPRYQKTAIIFISAVHLTDLDRIKGYQRGAMDYISVPVVPELLKAKVSLFADLYRKTRALESLNRELEERVSARTEQLRESEAEIRSLNAQLELRVAELEAIMKVLPVGVSVAHDPECKVVTGNAALCELLEATSGENISPLVEGEPAYYAYLNGRRLPAEEIPLMKAIADRKPTGNVELELRLKNGRKLHTIASANPLFDDAGKVRGAVGALHDITERKRMERELRDRADLLELAAEAIVVRDLDGIVSFWNSGAVAVYGFSAEEALGRNLHELLQTKFPVPESDIEFTITQGRRWEGNLIQRTKDGRELVVASRKILQRDGRKRRAVLEICRDITAQLQSEEALRRSEKLAAMGKMAGIIAHEINNPLESILNLFYLLRNHPSLDGEAQRYTEMAEQELLRVAHITKQTLGFYRESPRAIPVSMESLLDDLLELQERQLEKSGVVIERQYRNSRPVQGFPVELKQVFLNLVGNAIEAMPGGGTLRISVRDAVVGSRNGVRVFISDTGTGIKPEDARRLFEPFFSTKSSKGTGLGLWISQGIVRKYDGAIRFRSARVSGSSVTCFSVFLPSFTLPQELREASFPSQGPDPSQDFELNQTTIPRASGGN
jgi:PAS domain S-box-containing protein